MGDDCVFSCRPTLTKKSVESIVSFCSVLGFCVIRFLDVFRVNLPLLPALTVSLDTCARDHELHVLKGKKDSEEVRQTTGVGRSCDDESREENLHLNVSACVFMVAQL